MFSVTLVQHLCSGRSASGATWPCLCLCCPCVSAALRGCRSAGSVTATSLLNLASTSLCSPSPSSSAEEPNPSSRCCTLNVPLSNKIFLHYQNVYCVSCNWGGTLWFFQAQVDEFEKRLTAVHTRGLENVESPEMDEENQKQGDSPDKTVTHTPLPSRGRTRAKRGHYT